MRVVKRVQRANAHELFDANLNLLVASRIMEMRNCALRHHCLANLFGLLEVSCNLSARISMPRFKAIFALVIAALQFVPNRATFLV
jgi:hypothetical protein